MFFKRAVKLLFLFLYFSMCCEFNTLEAQVYNNEDIFVGDNSILYFGTNSFNFGTGTIATSRTKLSSGVLSFSDDTIWLGANERHFIDGYAQTLSKSAFILPIGQSGIYAPIQVISSSSNGVEAAYFRTSPNSIGSVFDTLVSSVSSVEYWDIKSVGVAAAISLSWRSSSAVSDLTSARLDALTIVGWDGLAWVAIPSIVDKNSILGETSTLVSGSISTNTVVDLSAYSAFSLGATVKKPKIPALEDIKLTAYIHSNQLFLESSLPITGLTIYNLMGKQISAQDLKGEFKHDQPFNYPESLYIAKIELDNGAYFLTKKVINTN
ncbi:hypothetical protein ACM55I_13795 [Flavobacterium sp. GB2R13]|uniref:hypothetical protein n=1 Tax=Flavobacterium algoris TaxID=3398733 RepID=UPI003A840D10